jgi:predicted RNA binding protein YcfA (HicA-like mRNA interferase family)
MRLPRDLSGADLVKRLGRFGYGVTRQTGSHLRLTSTAQGEHHTPSPTTIRYGLARWRRYWIAWLSHHGLTRDALLHRLLE